MYHRDTSVRNLTNVEYFTVDKPEDKQSAIEEDELQIPQPLKPYERVQEALKLEETFRKKAQENKNPYKKTTEIKAIDTKKEKEN